MYLVQGIHPTTPGVRAILCATPERAAVEAKALVTTIGDDIATIDERDPLADGEWAPGWALAKANDWEAALGWLKANTLDGAEEFDVWIDEMEPVDADAINEVISEELESGVSLSVYSGTENLGSATLPAARQHELRERELHEALALAIGHVDHMAGFIGRLKAGYSFESLGEDYSQMRQALDALPIGRHLARRVEQLGAKLATDDPLPVALAMIDQIINIGGEPAMLARAGKKALAQMVYAGTELHASLGEAIERHVYDFDNGDVIEPDCTFTAAMRRWADVMRGDPMVYATPASPLPWRAVISDKRAYLTDARDAGTGIVIENPTPSEKRNLLALLDAVNAQASIAMTPEVAVIMEGGQVQTVVGRGEGEPITVHIVDYDVEKGETGPDIVDIRQDGRRTAPARIGTHRKIPMCINGEPFWQTIRSAKAPA